MAKSHPVSKKPAPLLVSEPATTTLVEEFTKDPAPTVAEPPLVKVEIPGNSVEVILPVAEAQEIKSILPEVVIKKRQIWADPPGGWVDAE